MFSFKNLILFLNLKMCRCLCICVNNIQYTVFILSRINLLFSLFVLFLIFFFLTVASLIHLTFHPIMYECTFYNLLAVLEIVPYRAGEIHNICVLLCLKYISWCKLDTGDSSLTCFSTSDNSFHFLLIMLIKSLPVFQSKNI